MVNGRSRRTRWPTTRSDGVHNLAPAGMFGGRVKEIVCTAQSWRLPGAGINGNCSFNTA
jgi:hypothetical protein